jgi:hypothetical protein
MRLVVFLSAAVAASWFAPLGLAADLTRVDRTIRKEPAYQTKPRYALLVLGPKAETRIWLVIDGKTLHVDRNGNGDLTDDGEPVSAEKTDSTDTLEWRAGGFVEADGKTRHSNLLVYQSFHRQFGHLVNSVGVMDVRGTVGQTTDGEEGGSFADTPKDAPVIHVNGPLTLRAHSVRVEYPGGSRRKVVPFQLDAGERLLELHVQVGTPGLGRGTFAAIAVEGFPENVHPAVRMVVPSKAGPNRTVEAEFSLMGRC